MTVKAFAKINIGLQIVRKRDDGYHDIDTIFHRVDLHDKLNFSRRERGITLHTNNPSLPTDESNLCVRACRQLFDASGYDAGLHIELEKSIPFGAGLGGGSSDAASTLLAVNEFLDIGFPLDELKCIAGGIGSDVPYFMDSGSAYAKGTGDILSYFNINLPYYIVLVNPGLHVSTPWAYNNFQFNPSLPIVNLQQILLENIHSPLTWVNRIRNDFEPVVFREFQDIMRVKEILYRTGAVFSLMSGSGSSVFGFFESESYAHEARDFFGRKYQAWITKPEFKGM